MRKEGLGLGGQRLRRGEEVIRELGARNVPQQDGLAGVADDGEAAVGVRLQNAAQRGDGVARGGEDDEVLDPGHDLRRGDVGDVEQVVVRVVEEGVLVEADPRLVDAPAAKGVADPLGDHDGDHDGEDVRQGARELEHDDDNGHGHARHARQGGGGADDGVGARVDAGQVGLALLKGEELGVVVHPNLHDDAHGAPDQGANGHGGEDDAGGDLEAKGEGREEEADDGGEEEQHDGAHGGGACLAEAELVVQQPGALGEQVRHQLGGLGAHVQIGVVDQGGEDGYGDDLGDGAGKPGRLFLPLSYFHVEFDEQASVYSLEVAVSSSLDVLVADMARLTPIMPMIMNGAVSKACQSVSYLT